MSKLPVLFGLHNHQPLGNFHQVVERLTNTCYRPFLKAILGDFREWGDFANQPFESRIDGGTLIFVRDGGLYVPGSSKRPVRLTKSFIFKNRGWQSLPNTPLKTILLTR